MAEVDDETAAEVVRLRDEEGRGWKDISLDLKLSEKGSPKKAKRIYGQWKGEDPPAAPAAKKTTKKATSKKKKPGGMTADQAKKATSPTTGNLDNVSPDDPEAELKPFFFSDTPEEEIASRIAKHKITVCYLNDKGTKRVNEYAVTKVVEFGHSGKNPRRWVKFLDNEQKTRTVPISSIVGVH